MTSLLVPQVLERILQTLLICIDEVQHVGLSILQEQVDSDKDLEDLGSRLHLEESQ